MCLLVLSLSNLYVPFKEYPHTLSFLIQLSQTRADPLNIRSPRLCCHDDMICDASDIRMISWVSPKLAGPIQNKHVNDSKRSTIVDSILYVLLSWYLGDREQKGYFE